MSEYQEKLTRYARGLYQLKYKVEAPPDSEGSIEVYGGGGGCPTCGYGGEGSMTVYCGTREVGEFSFNNLDKVLAGIIEA